MSTCLNCGEEFVPKRFHPNQKHCSRICRDGIYRVTHREKCITANRKYRATHREERLIADRKRHAEYPEKQRDARRKWAAVHPEEIRAIKQARRAQEAKADGRFTASEFLDLCDRTGNQCVCCGSTGKLSADHIVPLSKGGSNSIDNIQPLCGHCNSKKHTKTIDYRPWADWT